MNFAFPGDEYRIGVDDQTLGRERAVMNLKTRDPATDGGLGFILAKHESQTAREINAGKFCEGRASGSMWQHRRDRTGGAHGELMDRAAATFKDHTPLQ